MLGALLIQDYCRFLGGFAFYIYFIKTACGQKEPACRLGLLSAGRACGRGAKTNRGYYLANKNIDVHLLLNSESPIELAESCSWIRKTYPISVSELSKYGGKAKCLEHIPKTWDYIINDDRIKRFKRKQDSNDLVKAKKVLTNTMKSRIAQGYLYSHILPYKPNPTIRLQIPGSARNFARRYKHKGTAIAVMLGGSAGGVQSPTVKMWLRICQALSGSIPNLKIYFTGVTKSVKGRTRTADFTVRDVKYLVKHLPNAESTYDIGLWNQLALIESCDIFLSPHTGFAFLAPLVGTPWLALSNCRWPEYLFNRVKFYSVLPTCGSYPALNNNKTGCGWLLAHDKKALCMTDELLAKKMPEIVYGAKLLLDPKFTYRKALNMHLRKIRKPPYNFKRFFFLDGINAIKS